MKAVMLDVDGVLNHGSGPLDAENVASLNEITDATGAKIVVHSSRRYFQTLEQLRDMLNQAGVTAEIVAVAPFPEYTQTPTGIFVPDENYRVFLDKTDLPYRFASERPAAVLLWLRENPVESFVVLDDAGDFFGTELEPNFVHTESTVGLTAQNVRKAIAILQTS